MFQQAKWIWTEENTRPDDWVVFRQSFQARRQSACILLVSAETRYFLRINGKLAVLDGSLLRDADVPHSGYYDRVDIGPFLRDGANTLELLAWYWGNGGRNSNPNPHAGVIFECAELGLHSGKETRCARHEAYRPSSRGDQPSFLYGGYNIEYDANREDPAGFRFRNATEYGPDLYGPLFERPIPLFRFSRIHRKPWRKDGDNLYRVRLPAMRHVFPYFKVHAAGGETIDIRTDRYVTRGGPGDHTGRYNGHRTEYRCKPGENEFLGLDWQACEALLFTIPPSVTVLSLGYRITEYDADILPILRTGDREADRLLRKCARTLKACMRDNFMDCPDRERGQWIGDICVQAPQVFYALDRNAIPLLKKAIRNFILLRRGDVLVGNVPGIHAGELPPQSLNAISDIGMIRVYYDFTGDREVLDLAFEPAIRYLALWPMGPDGRLGKREGDWYWFDHLANCDRPILESCWYYLALRFARFMADTLDRHDHDAFLDSRMDAIRRHFDPRFWKASSQTGFVGAYASQDGWVDERANAMAVLSGLAGSERYPEIADVLISTGNCSTYMEGYVCEALCRMGRRDLACRRLMARYHHLARNGDSTLWEDFNILGTRNHAWTGAPLTLFYRHFLGMRSDDFLRTILFRPDFSLFRQYDVTLDLPDGRLSLSLRPGQAEIRNTSSSRVVVEEA